MNTKQISYHYIIITILSLAINFLFWGGAYKRYFFSGLIANHGELGFNLCNNNKIQISPDRLQLIKHLQNKEFRLIDPLEVTEAVKQPLQFRSVNDTIGYGVLLGLLWKLTGSLRYQDVQILQIFLFTLTLFLLYKISLLLFANRTIAFYSCIAQLFFFPLIFLNVHPIRDIWAYYGIIVLLYGLLNASNKTFATIWWALVFVICQWIRPTIVFTVLAVGLPIFIWRKKLIKPWLIFIAMNIFLFWIPFIYYNKIAYNRWFVSSMGQDLYEGLGEYPNSWGIQMNDIWCANLLYEQFGLKHGTPEYQDKALALFWHAVKTNPLEYFLQLCRRSITLIFFAANWSFEAEELNTLKQIPTIGPVLYSLLKCIGYILAKFQYVRLYLLAAWLSAYLLFTRKKYFELFLLVLIAWSCASKFPSQLEPRYLVPYYAIFSLFIGYGFFYLKQWIIVMLNNYRSGLLFVNP